MNLFKIYDQTRLDYTKGKATFEEVCIAHKNLPKPYSV